MRVLVHPRLAAPALRAIAPQPKRKIKAALRMLGQDPSGVTNQLDVKRLDAGGGQPMWRLRVGEWRVAFTVDDVVLVLRVFHRSEGYGWLMDMR